MPERFMMSPASNEVLSPTMLGYWSDEQRHDAPDKPAVFCVLRAAEHPESGEMGPQELLYIGEHRSARYALEHHEDHDKWRDFLQEGEELWYSVGLTGNSNRERLAAAMINAHKPRFNSHSPYLDRFPFERTTVHVYGKSDKLQGIFTVEPRE